MESIKETLNNILWCLNEIREVLAGRGEETDVMDLKATARHFGKDPKTIKRWVETGKLPARRIQGNTYSKWLFSKKELEDFKEDCY